MAETLSLHSLPFLSRVDKLYTSIPVKFEDDAVLPAWAKMLIQSFRCLCVDVKSHAKYNSKSFKQLDIKCRLSEELIKKVVKEKEQLEQKIELLESVIKETEQFSQRNRLLISCVKEISTEIPDSNIVNKQKRQLPDLTSSVNNSLCQRFIEENRNLQQKVELLEEVMDEIDQYSRSNCLLINEIQEIDTTCSDDIVLSNNKFYKEQGLEEKVKQWKIGLVEEVGRK